MEDHFWRIWELEAIDISLKPKQSFQPATSSVSDELWAVEGGETVLFQEYHWRPEQSLMC